MSYSNLPEELQDKLNANIALRVAAGMDEQEAVAAGYAALTGRKIAGVTQGPPDSTYWLLSLHPCCAGDCSNTACWTVNVNHQELHYCNTHLPTGLKTLADHNLRFAIKADNALTRTPAPGRVAVKLAQEVNRDDVTAAMIQQEIIDPWLVATIGTPASDRLQLLTARTFGHSYPASLEPLVKVLHWDLLYVIGQIYNDTEAFLKGKGFQRWQTIPVYHPYLTSLAVPKQWQVGDEVRIKLNPATSWTLDPAEAAKVATFLASRSAPALVLKTFIPASCVISSALTGFGTPGTEELVLAGGEYEALVDQRYEGRTKEHNPDEAPEVLEPGVKVRNYLVDDPVNRDWVKLLLVLEAQGKKGGFVTIDDRVVFMGGAGEGGGAGGGISSNDTKTVSFSPGTTKVDAYDDVAKIMRAGFIGFPYVIDSMNQVYILEGATIHTDITGNMNNSVRFAKDGGLLLRVSRGELDVTGSGILEPSGIRRLQDLLLDLKIPTGNEVELYVIHDLTSNRSKTATFNSLVRARQAEDLNPFDYKSGSKSFVTLKDGHVIFIGGAGAGGGGAAAATLHKVTGTSYAGKPFEATVGNTVDPEVVGKNGWLLLAPGGMIVTAVNSDVQHADLADAVGLHPADYDHAQRFAAYPDHLYTTTTSLGSTQIGLAECFDNLQRASLRLIEGGYSPDTQMVLAVPGKGPVRLTLAEWTGGKKALAMKAGHFATIDDRVVFMGGAGEGGGGAAGATAPKGLYGKLTRLEKQDYAMGHFPSYLAEVEGEGKVIVKDSIVYRDALTGDAEVAAYEVSQQLGYSIVPETIQRTDPSGKTVSVQRWIEGAIDGYEVDTESLAVSQVKQLLILDTVIGNRDRVPFNYLQDRAGNIHAIDHGVAFPRDNDIFYFAAKLHMDSCFPNRPTTYTTADFEPVRRLLGNTEFMQSLTQRFGDSAVLALRKRANELIETNGEFLLP